MVFGVIPLPEKKFWQWASAHASMAYQLKSSYFGAYLMVALQNKVLNSLRAEQEYFKDCLAEFSNITCHV